MITIGIDPGKKYACAIIRTIALQKTVISLTDTKESTLIALRGVFDSVSDLSSINAWIENVGAMAYVSIDKQTGAKTVKSQKGTSNFKFGFDTGWFYGLFDCQGVELNLVRPQVWLRELNIPSRKKPSDIPYFIPARQSFPSVANLLKYKTKDHDKAAALMIAEYGIRSATHSLTACKPARIETIYSFNEIEKI